jgi:hypothetical protein
MRSLLRERLSAAGESPMPRMISTGLAFQLLFQTKERPLRDVDHVPGSPQQEPGDQT